MAASVRPVPLQGAEWDPCLGTLGEVEGPPALGSSPCRRALQPVLVQNGAGEGQASLIMQLKTPNPPAQAIGPPNLQIATCCPGTRGPPPPSALLLRCICPRKRV